MVRFKDGGGGYGLFTDAAPGGAASGRKCEEIELLLLRSDW